MHAPVIAVEGATTPSLPLEPTTAIIDPQLTSDPPAMKAHEIEPQQPDKSNFQDNTTHLSPSMSTASAPTPTPPLVMTDPQTDAQPPAQLYKRSPFVKVLTYCGESEKKGVARYGCG